jgi:phosphoserine phosphatase
VEEALRVVGIDVSGLAAARARTEAGRILPAMAEPVPYGAAKGTYGKQLLSGHDWLGSFGDNAFDVDMLRAARVGVAVCPKPVLVSRLHELPNTIVLE